MKKMVICLCLVISVCLSGCSIFSSNDSTNSKPEPETVIVKETVIVTETVYVTEPNDAENIKATTTENSERRGYTTQDVLKKAAEAALDALVASVEWALKKGEKVQLVGFGTFEVRQRAARKGRNPQTKAEIKIPASKAPVFKAGKALKDLVNNK